MASYTFPVEIQDAYTPSGKKIKNKRAVVRTDTGDALAIVSPGYSLLTHDEVVDPFEKVIQAISARTGARPVTRFHLNPTGSVLNYVTEFKDHTKDLAVGDKCGLRVIIRNSYDGSGCTQVRVGALVLSCLNGMVRHSGFSDLRIRHTGDAKGRLRFPETSELLEEFDNGWRIWDSYSSRKLREGEYEGTIGVLEKVGALTPSTAREWATGPISGRPLTAWGLLQDVTYNLTHQRDRMGEEARLRALTITDRIFAERFLHAAH